MRFKEARTSIRGNNTSDESIIGQLLPETEIFTISLPAADFS
jgi:hypothetical protein